MNQAGFRTGRSCVDQCFALRQLIEKSLEMQLAVKINFIDFKAAFDSVHRDSLWKVLRAYGIPEKIVNIMKNTYEGSECCVKVDGEVTGWFPVTAGVRQGCIWSPLLFGVLIDWVLKNALDKNDMGIVLERRRSSRYQQQRLSDLDFADDIALIDEPEMRLQFSTSQVEEKGARVGLTLLPILTHRNVRKQTKARIFQAVVITTLLYGAETWNSTVQEEKRLSAFYNRCLRRMIGVTWQDHMSNEQLFKLTGQPPLTNLLRRKRLTWLGHVVRMASTHIPRRLLYWEPPGRRKPGRQRMRWRDTVARDLKQASVTFEEAQRLAQDREAWSALVKALCGAPMTAHE